MDTRGFRGGPCRWARALAGSEIGLASLNDSAQSPDPSLSSIPQQGCLVWMNDPADARGPMEGKPTRASPRSSDSSHARKGLGERYITQTPCMDWAGHTLEGGVSRKLGLPGRVPPAGNKVAAAATAKSPARVCEIEMARPSTLTVPSLQFPPREGNPWRCCWPAARTNSG